jgi:predicted transcriptional regulator
MDELFERLSFIEHVKAGLKDIEEGRVFSQEELEIEMEKW